MSEQWAVRVDSAEASTTAAPTTSSDGIAIPASVDLAKDVHLLCQKGAASSTRTMRVKVHGYVSKLIDTSLAAVASSDAWYEIFDTETQSDAADFNLGYLLSGLRNYSRLATEVVTNGGTTPTLTTAFGFSPDDTVP